MSAAMHYFHHLILFASTALAWPSIAPRKYSISGTDGTPVSAQLATGLQQDWYDDFSSDTSDVQKPSDPASFYTCADPKIQSFPNKDGWLSFKTLWDINAPEITSSNGASAYNEDIKAAIQEVSTDTKVDARLILILIMQESTGKLTIGCTAQTNCGLLQHGGSRQFDAANAKSSIKGMIEDGILGTSNWPGFLNYFNRDSTSMAWLGTEQFWRGNPFGAGHVYNVGSINSTDLTVGPSGVHGSNTYASDMLSRLQGWNGWDAGCQKSKQCGSLGFGGRACYK